MPAPNADGPDWSRYQTFTGRPFDPYWQLYSNKATEGRTYVDPTFKTRWLQWRDMGLKYRGAYHWLRGDSPMRDQAEHFCRTLDSVGGLQRGEFVQADWETTTGVALPTSVQAQEWCDRVQQHYGRECVVMYSSDWLPDSTLDADSRAEFMEWREENPDFPYWHANYNLTDRSYGGWAECAKYRADIWQWTSSYVHSSVVGRFDMNHVFDWSTLDRITDQLPPPPPQPEPEEPPVVYFYRDRRYKNVWLVGPGGAVAVGPAVVAAAGDTVPMIVDEHHQSLISVMATSGLRPDDLVDEV